VRKFYVVYTALNADGWEDAYVDDEMEAMDLVDVIYKAQHSVGGRRIGSIYITELGKEEQDGNRCMCETS